MSETDKTPRKDESGSSRALLHPTPMHVKKWSRTHTITLSTGRDFIPTTYTVQLTLHHLDSLEREGRADERAGRAVIDRDPTCDFTGS